MTRSKQHCLLYLRGLQVAKKPKLNQVITLQIFTTDDADIGDELWNFQDTLTNVHHVKWIETIVDSEGCGSTDTSWERLARFEEEAENPTDKVVPESDGAKRIKALIAARKGQEITAEQHKKIEEAVVEQHTAKKLTPSKSSEEVLAQLKERMKKRNT